ncbi:Rrf2 family transcriptional regulator [Alkalicoccobacillus porphyridii]|uniref:Rrf2 family transcriptional regulator n=1 Tax=Alkalicoccobacillus porphyridii TaxID=2597270 RepID=A0A554A1T9_9BACI|nr:Rrf2 family transcriptional regulator [Alkalicoccobacillus porphyridii]TSB47652.1 Rrf2 family transcriptional regulator [Alkalicoccobacillus porphyridii]
MRVKGGVEQAACILVILATQIKDVPVKSDVISERLQVSSSYLKKVMRKLVVHNLIQSVSGTNGGFTLARPIEEVTALELFEAIEGTDEFLQLDGVFQRTFPESSFLDKGEEIFKDAFLSAQQSYRERLADFTLEEMLKQITGFKQLELHDWNQTTPQIWSLNTFLKGAGDTK